VLRLAAERQTKAVLHVSTKGVFSPDAWPGDAPILEDTPLRPLHAHALGYQHTKWAAERLVTAARERGIPTAVVRPGRIGGDLGTGRVPEDDLMVRFIRGCIELGAVPDVSGFIEIVPVDVVSRAIVGLVDRDAIWGHAFHLMHPAPLPLAAAVGCLRRAGHDVALLPYLDWRARLCERVARGEPSALAPLLGMFGETPPERVDDRRFDATNTRAMLGAPAIPSIEDQLERTLCWLRTETPVRAGVA
jgi:thioester reductase-like protein